MTEEEDQTQPPGRFPDGEVISTFNYKVYARAGLSRDEADEWAARGVRPYHAEAFRQAGFDISVVVEATAAIDLDGSRRRMLSEMRQGGIKLNATA